MSYSSSAFTITNWLNSVEAFNPCTNTLFAWSNGVPPFRLSYILGNLTGGCASTVSTQGAWWPIDSITGYGPNTTTEWETITWVVTDSTGAVTPGLVEPMGFQSSVVYNCVNAPGVFSSSTDNQDAPCEEAIGLSSAPSTSVGSVSTTPWWTTGNATTASSSAASAKATGTQSGSTSGAAWSSRSIPRWGGVLLAAVLLLGNLAGS